MYFEMKIYRIIYLVWLSVAVVYMRRATNHQREIPRSESENCRRADLARARAYRRWGGSVKSASCQWVISNFFSKCDRNVSNAMGYEVQFTGDHVNWNGAIFYLFFFNRNISFTRVVVLEGSYFRNSWYNKNVFNLLSKQTHLMRILLMFNEQNDKDRYHDDNSIILLFELWVDMRFPFGGTVSSFNS